MRKTHITEADWEMHDPSVVVFKRRPKITEVDINTIATEIETFRSELPSLEKNLKCHPLFGPQFRKVKIRFAARIP